MCKPATACLQKSMEEEHKHFQDLMTTDQMIPYALISGVVVIFLSFVMGNGAISFNNKAMVKGANGEIAKSIFDFNISPNSGEVISLSTYAGKSAYLIVNLASK